MTSVSDLSLRDLESDGVARFRGVEELAIGHEGSKYGSDERREVKHLCLGGVA